MGIRRVSHQTFLQSEEEWTITEWKQISEEAIRQIANEVIGFGLEVELAESMDDNFIWRIVAIKE
jgi:hypothetical protein